MTWGPHDLRLAEALGEQRREAARRAGVNLHHRFRGRRALEWRDVIGHLHLHWPIHLHHAAHGAAGHH
jgi:hypothetical protein